MKDVINRAGVIGPAHVLLEKLKPRFVFQVGEVALASSNEVVHANHMVALAQKGVTQMRSDETCATSYQHPHNDPFSLKNEWTAAAGDGMSQEPAPDVE